MENAVIGEFYYPRARGDEGKHLTPLLPFLSLPAAGPKCRRLQPSSKNLPHRSSRQGLGGKS